MAKGAANRGVVKDFEQQVCVCMCMWPRGRSEEKVGQKSFNPKQRGICVSSCMLVVGGRLGICVHDIEVRESAGKKD